MDIDNTTKMTARKACIACGQEFGEDVKTCPTDGTVLTTLMEEDMVGKQIGDKYEILEVIGGGGMGLIYKARHLLMKRIVAIKMMHPRYAANAMTLKRFQQEAQAASCLSHPNILTVFDFGLTEDGRPYLVMDYLEGTNLAEVLDSVGSLRPKRALPIFIQACQGLYHAHSKGVVHRDLKPGNIMLVEFEGEEDFVKIVDFGIAKLMPAGDESSHLTQTGEVFGSPLYMSPEQCRGKELDPRSDIYSMGCVMYRTLSGIAPFIGEDPMQCMYKQVNEMPDAMINVNPEATVSEELEKVVLKALAKDPDDRYQTMLEMKEALEAVKSGKSTVEQQMSTTFDMPVATETTADMKKEVAHVSEALKNKEQAPAPDSAGTADATTGFAAASGNAAATISTTASGTNIPALSAPSSSDNPSASTPSGTFSSLPGLTVSASGPLHTASPAPLGAGTPVIPTHGAAPVAPNAVKDLMKRPWFPYAVGGAIATIGTIFFMSLIPGKQNPAHVPGTVSDLGHSSSPTGKPAALNGTETAAQLNDGAQQDLDNNRFKEALTAATMALDKATKSNNVPEKIRAIDMLSEAHFALAEYDKATKECHTVIVLSGEDAKTPMVANALNRLGKMEIARGQLDEASRDLTKALAIREKFTGPEHAAVVNSYSALGDLAMHQNKYKDAIKYLEKASMIASSTMGADDPSTAMIQNQLGQAYTGMGNYTLARTYYQKALDSRLKAFGPDDATVADSYTCLGSLEFVKRNTKASEDYFKKAEAIYAKSIGLNNLQSAVVEFCLGVINEKNKNWSTAADYYKRCLTARQTQLNSTDPKVKQARDHYQFCLARSLK